MPSLTTAGVPEIFLVCRQACVRLPGGYQESSAPFGVAYWSLEATPMGRLRVGLL
ncbi:hypothetical protein C8Q80DRAFT_1197180 [Daedaleopsis nitida]|nr:hypothetical protein C8Q80DRAFT_1197180 [Daedaleopsis nitida]